MKQVVTSTLVLLLLLEALVVGFRLSSRSAPYDDAFITFRYARNFAEGRGFTYNPGSPSLGTTSPSFALTLGTIQRISRVDPAISANWICALALALAGWFSFRLVAVDFGLWAGGLAALSMSLNPMLLSAWGGEWLVAAPAVLAGFYYYRIERLNLAAVAFSIAIVLRPEAALAAVFPFADAWWRRTRGVLQATLVSVAMGLAWMALASVVIGEVMPSTFATKLAHARSGLFGSVLGGLRFVGAQFIRADLRMLLLVVLAWHGALAAATRSRVWLLMGLWIAAHLLFYTWLRLPFYHWYLVPVAAFMSLGFAASLPVVSAYIGALLGSRRYAGIVTAIVMIPLFGAGLLAEYSSSAYWIRIKPDPRERMYNHIGTWLAGNTPEGASVAYLEIGRIGYFSRRPIVDLMGLVTPGVADHVAQQDLLWAVHEHKPDYYLISSTFTWAGSPAGEPWFAGAYEKVMDFSAPDFDGVITVYRKRSDAIFPAAVAVEAVQLLNRGIVGDILPGTTHGQTFSPIHDRLSGVAVLLATYARRNTGGVTFRLEQVDPPRVIVDERFDMADVRDNLWREFRFPAIEGSGGKQFKLTIAAGSAQPGNAITVWYNPRDSYRRGERLINDVPARGDLAVKLFYVSSP